MAKWQFSESQASKAIELYEYESPDGISRPCTPNVNLADMRAAITAAVGPEVDALREAILKWSSAEFKCSDAWVTIDAVNRARADSLELCGYCVCDDCEAHYPADQYRDDELCPDCGREADIQAAEIADEEQDDQA
jgi:hypothetical protein